MPSAVFEELTNPLTPDNVRQIISMMPAWLRVHQSSGAIAGETQGRLGKRELEAIMLAEAVRPDFLLLDEKMGRSVALKRNLPVMGTLGLLERADRLGLIDLPVVLSELKKSGFFMSASLEDLLLRRNRQRHSK